MKLLLLILAMPIIATAAFAGVSAAPWLPTKPKQRRDLIDSLDLRDGDVCYDLGCGDGSVLFAVARKNPNVTSIGYEISLLPWFAARVRKVLGGKKYRNVSIRYGNLFKQNLSDANLVFVFLLAKSYPRLAKKFGQELDHDARVVVEAWPIPDVAYIQKIKKDGLLPVYIYAGSSFR
jgi:precorrin-6B methylase 2